MDRPPLLYGGVRVPYTVAWGAEEDRFGLTIDPHFKRLAIVQDVRPGVGKPRFGKPHMQRQREAIASCLCDVCGRSLRAATKVSLSHARVRLNGADGSCVMQVEPLLHRVCAAVSLRQCPSLKRDVADGSVMIRQVLSWRAQCALMTAAFVETLTGKRRVALGHAKVELKSWIDRPQRWLEAA